MNIFNDYKYFKEKSLKTKHTKHKNIVPLILKLKNKPIFQTEIKGYSIENRTIYSIKTGNGKQKILLFSQMHGDEATGTQAVFDILNFISNPKKYKKERDYILKKCTLFFIPMLNPDGAEQNKRENAAGIDINRDARKLQSPESKILMKTINKINADFVFTLHDQSKYYAAGNTKKPATVSFLAPAYDYEKSTNKTRAKSMKIIVKMKKVLENYIPKQICKYSDFYMPASFGDNFQKKGISTILLESGYYENDAEKQFVRKLNFTAILNGIKSIADKSYKKEKIKNYKLIPFNASEKLFDYIIRNVEIERNGQKFITDVGIRKDESKKNPEYHIDETGDLSDYCAWNEIIEKV